MSSAKLKVVVTPNPPFIAELGGKYSGFEIELWEAIAKQIGKDFEYKKLHFQDLIPSVVGNKADVALGSITINKDREELVDFSHSVFSSGLHILLSKNRSKVTFGETAKSFLIQGYKQLVKPLLALLVIILLFGNIFWLAEKDYGSLSSAYFPGIFQAIWFSLSTIIGSDGGIFVYKVNAWSGRLIFTVGQIVRLAVLGLIIGEITAFITMRKIRLAIEKPEDLRGKSVATVKGSTSEPVLQKLGALVLPVRHITEAYQKLKEGAVEAVVFDGPILTYYALNDGADWSEVVGELFEKQDYGLVWREGDALGEEINRAILTLKENGFYDLLYKKYFEVASLKK